MKLEAARVVWITFVGDRTELFPVCPDDKGLVVALVDWEIAEGIRVAPGCYGPSGGGQITRGYFEAEAAKVLAWWKEHGLEPVGGIWDAWEGTAETEEEENEGVDTVQPITPEEAGTGRHIPEVVIAAFNELIQETFDGHTAYMTQEAALRRICILDPNLARVDICKKGYLNIASRFEAAGWTVVYDKPGFNERGDAVFCFTRRP